MKYVYGVVPAEAKLPSHPGIAGNSLELVCSDGVAALVSDAPDGELTMGREAMTAHARVLEAAHALGTVLPMRFGVVMTDKAEVTRSLLESHREDLLAQLEEFNGKAELKLRATYEEEPMLREVVQEDQDVARLRESLRGAPQDATYYGRIQLGELVSRAIERKREHDAQSLLVQLSPLALATELTPPPHERIVLNASFLVDRVRMTEFDAAVERVGERQAGRMRFKYTGPLPPHSFVKFEQAG
ncbi:MAG: GvpL/GvpF family gas vesicle protein [Solirubrobacteraceae bacterium]